MYHPVGDQHCTHWHTRGYKNYVFPLYIGCLIVPEVVVGDPSTGPLFHQQCVIAANLETLPEYHIIFTLHLSHILNISHIFAFLAAIAALYLHR